MPISKLVELGTVRFTAQELADMALHEDQARRAALARSDYFKARQHGAESDKLADYSKEIGQ